MGERFLATLDSEGQIALPAELVAAWRLRPGDQIAFAEVGDRSSRVEPVPKRSFFDRLDEFRLPSLGRPLSQTDIEESIAEAMSDKEQRSRGT